jgi:hypothetical protein
MDVTMPPETHSEHIARSKQAGVPQSDSKLKCPFALVLRISYLKKEKIICVIPFHC